MCGSERAAAPPFAKKPPHDVAPYQMRLGIIGLGQAGALILDDIRKAQDPRWRIVAGADPREHAREAFAQEFGCNVYADAAELVRDRKRRGRVHRDAAGVPPRTRDPRRAQRKACDRRKTADPRPR